MHSAMYGIYRLFHMKGAVLFYISAINPIFSANIYYAIIKTESAARLENNKAQYFGR
jgi:hypothetical protein